MSRLRQALGLPEQRSYENPAVPLSGKNLAGLLGWGGMPTDAGPEVDEQSALRYGAVLACVRVRSEALGMLDCAMYQRQPDGSRKEAADHPAQYLLQVAPNPEMTPAVWKETLNAHLDTWGNAYARIEWDGAGRPRALWPLLPHLTRPERVRGTYRLRYTTVWREQQVVLEPEEVLHVPGLGFDGVTGYSPIGLQRQAVGIGLAAERFTSAFYGNGAWMSGFFEHPEALGDEAHKHLKDSLKDDRAGAANAFSPMVLEEGMKWHQVSLPGEDALFLGLRKLQRREIAAAYRVPPHMIADLEAGASYSSIEHLGLEFATYTLGSPMKRWAQELTRKLGLAPSYYVGWDLEDLVKADAKTQAEVDQIGISSGWLNPNEARAKRDLAPYPGGGQYQAPLNMGRVGASDDDTPDQGAPASEPEGFQDSAGGTGGTDASTPAAVVDAHQVLLVDAADRQVRREVDRLNRRLRKQGTAAELVAWLQAEHLAAQPRYVEDLVRPALALAASLASTAQHVSPAHVAELVAEVVGLDQRVAAEGLAPAVAADQLDELLEGWGTNRPQAVAEQVVARIVDDLEG